MGSQLVGAASEERVSVDVHVHVLGPRRTLREWQAGQPIGCPWVPLGWRRRGGGRGTNDTTSWAKASWATCSPCSLPLSIIRLPPTLLTGYSRPSSGTMGKARDRQGGCTRTLRTLRTPARARGLGTALPRPRQAPNEVQVAVDDDDHERGPFFCRPWRGCWGHPAEAAGRPGGALATPLPGGRESRLVHDVAKHYSGSWGCQ